MMDEAPEPRFVVDPHTLDILVCPLTKTRLTLSGDKSELISIAARLAFPIRRGVPMLCLDEARPVEPESLKAWSSFGTLGVDKDSDR
jgi:uncharacterized protein